MSTSITNFNTVFVGESFPVQSVVLADFTFRGRKFQEQVRMGPALQASARDVSLLMLPDRFQVGVGAPDDLSIQVEGVREVVAVFRDYVGRRSVTHVGHNAQVLFSGGPEVARLLTDRLVHRSAAAELMGVADIRQAQVSFEAELISGAVTRMTVAVAPPEVGKAGALVDFNFDFDVVDGSVTVDQAMDSMSNCLDRVETISKALKAVYEGGRVAQ